MTPHSLENLTKLAKFAKESKFRDQGALFLDLDGTALHESEGHVYIPDQIKGAVKAVNGMGRHIVINTLRFPLSVIRTIGRDWHEINCIPIPTVLLNGSMVGYVSSDKKLGLHYEELDAYPLDQHEIGKVVTAISKMHQTGFSNMLLFFYPRDWTRDEIIWTPDKSSAHDVKAKYKSCSEVVHWGLTQLEDELSRAQTCMIFLLINAEGDELMAYQHTKKSSYFSHAGVSKKFGARQIAERLSISLPSSIGAGDTELDDFLSEMGLAVRVQNANISFRGLSDTISVSNSMDLGMLIKKFCDIHKSHN